jgi:hypothetical protein
MKENQQPLFKKRRGSSHLQTDHHRVRMHQGAEPVDPRGLRIIAMDNRYASPELFVVLREIHDIYASAGLQGGIALAIPETEGLKGCASAQLYPNTWC